MERFCCCGVRFGCVGVGGGGVDGVYECVVIK